MCQHIWAAVLAAEEFGWPDAVLTKTDTRPYETGSDFFEDDDAWPSGTARKRPSQRVDTPWGDWSSRSSRQRAPHRQAGLNDWQQYLEHISNKTPRPGPRVSPSTNRQPRQRQAWYVWNISSSFRDGTLMIDYYQQERRKNGEFGVLKRQAVGLEDVRYFEHPDDQRLLQLLIGNQSRDKVFSHFYQHHKPRFESSVVVPVMYDLLLPDLCATGRFIWSRDDQQPAKDAKPIRWDGGGPWHFALQVDADDAQKCWRLSGWLVRGNERVELRQPVILLSEGLVLFPDRVAFLKASDDFAWIVILRQVEVLTVPYAQRQEFLQRWWAMPRVPKTDLPAALQLSTEERTPTAHVRIMKSARVHQDTKLYATLHFNYGEYRADRETFQAGILDTKRQQVILRDREAEAALEQTLLGLGMQPNRGTYNEQGMYNFPSRNLHAIVNALIQQGWAVEAEGIRFRAPGTFSLQVRSGVDWFDLDGQFDFDGVTVGLPRVLEAVRQGESYVLLDDGSKGMLPAVWLSRYAKLAGLGQTMAGSVRFKSAQGLLLDALLAEQENVSVDRAFQHWRDKLQGFKGVEPRPQPQTFAGQLRPYQEEGLGWLHFLQAFVFGGCLADDMGLGKTVQVLALLEARRTRQLPEGVSPQPSIVVVPRSLVFNWSEEARRFTPQLRVLDYTGTGRTEQLSQIESHDVLLTTYGVMRRDIVTLKEVAFDYAILDEAQAIKNAASQTAKASRLLQAAHRLAMTGTPVENHLGELWSLFEFLNPGMLGSSKAFGEVAKSGETADTSGLDILASGLRPFILRRTKQQVLPELPEKTEQTVFCDMAGSQRRLYNELRDYYRVSLTERVQNVGLKRAKVHVLEALLRLRQVACHPGLVDAERSGEASAKVETLIEQLETVVTEGHKALVFSQFTSFLAIVRAHLDKRCLAYAYLDGRTRNRQERVTQFQKDPACPLFLISLKAGGHGLNLTAADYVFILDPWWNPAVEAQAVDRTHRIGQTRRVFAYRLICKDTVEEKILALQQHKRELADAIVSADNSVMRSLTIEDLQLLLS